MRLVAPVACVAGAVAVAGVSLVGGSGASAGVGHPGTSPATAATSALPAAHRAAGNVSVALPPVVFNADIAVHAGRLRTAVALADPAVTAAVHVVGSESRAGCSADLVQGQPRWLDCEVDGRPGAPTAIEVVLSDSRRFVRIVPAAPEPASSSARHRERT